MRRNRLVCCLLLFYQPNHLRVFRARQSLCSSAAANITTVALKTSVTGCTSEEGLYAYRRQRWMWNESDQLRRRHVKFDIKGLINVAEAAAGPDATCTEVAKLPEGNFNKAFMLGMSNGKQLIVKIPNPNAGSRYYTTASEVATMDYLRTKLEIPVPRILAYGLDATRSPLGAEYIIMEKAPGIELARIWDDLQPRDKSTIIEKIAEVTAQMSTATFPYYGSLYYQKDIPETECMVIDNSEFGIGPTTARRWFDDRRDEVDVHRGPWNSSHDLIRALTEREIACFRTFASFSPDCQQGIFNGCGYLPTHEAKLAVLHDFQKLLPHILPQRESLNKGILWHNDLHSDNIFVDADNPTHITSIIDWQATPIYPMFLTAKHPSIINFDGPKLERFTKPELPENFKKMSPRDKQAAKDLFLAQSLWLVYEICIQKKAPNLMQAFQAVETLQCQLLGAVGSVFDDGEPYVQSMITELVTDDGLWGKIVGTDDHGRVHVPCPLQYTEQELQGQRDEYRMWEQDIERKQRVIEEIGAYTGWNGAVLPDEYDEMKRRLKKKEYKFPSIPCSSL